ncbi:MAG: glucoamylase family protein [Burkholderiaceae bacterium]
MRFFADSEQSDAANATGFKGFYYHFLEMEGGRRANRCELSSIDTALLIAGALAAAEYFDRADSREEEIGRLARLLAERVDWTWMLGRSTTICHGWTPEGGFLSYRWQGYSEALVMVLLALGSTTHPIPSTCYAAWCASYEWRTLYDVDYLHAGPLFIHQMSHIWCDLRAIRDRFMRDHDCDYFENSRRATLIQQRYAIENPKRFPHYGARYWGITASGGPGPCRKTVDGIRRQFFGYVARGVPDGPDDGTTSPWAVATSLPFAPEIVAPTISHFASLPIAAAHPYGFRASFNRAFDDEAEHGTGWVSPYHYGINVGPTVLMIENYRSGLIWGLMRKCSALTAGLRAAGFSGGWLAEPSGRAGVRA